MFPPPLPVKLGKKLTIYLCVSVRLHGVIVQNMTNIAIILISHFKNFEYKTLKYKTQWEHYRCLGHQRQVINN